MTSAPTQVSDDDAKAAYLKRCMDMTHGQLYAELMRVHREATLLVQAAVEQEREECAKVCEMATDDEVYLGKQYADAIRSRGNHGNNT